MSLTALPEEVLEIILLNVNAEDVLNVLSAVGGRGSEGFWRKICSQNGFKNIHGEKESWKNVFCRNISWIKGSYLESEYEINDISIHDSNSSRCINSESEGVCESHVNKLNHPNSLNLSEQNFQLKRTKLLSQREGEVLIRDVEDPQKWQLKLQGSYSDRCNQSRTKFMIRTSYSALIYSYEKEHYTELMVLNDNALYCTSFVLTDDYFVALKTDLRILIIVEWSVTEEYSLQLSSKTSASFIVSIFERILTLITLDGSNYMLKRYHLESKEWLEELLLFGGAVMIGVPNVRINSRVVVSWSFLLEGRGVTPLKIWTSKGDSSLLPSSFKPIPSASTVQPEDVLWLMLEEDHVIYSTSKKSFSIFSAQKPEEVKEMPLAEDNHIGQNVISGLLVLSYTNCFKLVDFKKATFLYEVLLDGDFISSEFCVNEYFYVVFNKSGDNNVLKKLRIYDFRGKTLGSGLDD